MALIDRGMSRTGVVAALTSAVLFGAGTPLAKILLSARVDPWVLAGLLYCGSGIGLFAYRRVTRRPAVRPARTEWGWIGAAIVSGGMVGPLLLMAGLALVPASGASLLLNAEAVLTAVIAWVVFGEPAGRRIVTGMALIVAGAVVLSLPGTGVAPVAGGWGSLFVVGACAAWAIDNNLTRKVSLTDETWLAMVKGLVAGPVNLALGLATGAVLPLGRGLLGALLIGLFAYGVSLALFIVALRELGTSRAGAYFSTAPFVGAALAIALGAAFTWQLAGAGVLMAGGVALHLTERHAHSHTHDPIRHTHRHRHDDGHHAHEHSHPVAAGTWHTHEHVHEPTTHAHAHLPDVHHRHRH